MRWTEEELRLALVLYCQLPFGKIHARNPNIINLAEKIDRTPSSIAMKLVNFASLDPEIVSSGRNGLGNASKLDRKVWDQFQSNWLVEVSNAAELLDVIEDRELGMVDDELPTFVDTSRKSEVEIRKKQSIFRRMVLSSYTNVCCMSGLSDPRLLVASHIMPWSVNEENRLNPKNGLCLSALHDKAFDIGLLTVQPDYSIEVSSQLSKLNGDQFVQESLVSFHGKRIMLPEKFFPAPEFLEWHNRNRFLG